MTRTCRQRQRRRVLVVEDDEGIREMLKYNLASAGFSVQEARDGAAGLRTARTAQARPDPARPDAARHERAGLLSRSPQDEPGTNHHADGEGHRGRQDRRPRAGRGRLHNKALLDPRSAGSRQRGFAPCLARRQRAQVDPGARLDRGFQHRPRRAPGRPGWARRQADRPRVRPPVVPAGVPAPRAHARRPARERLGTRVQRRPQDGGRPHPLAAREVRRASRRSRS